jgi:hypothetical protein
MILVCLNVTPSLPHFCFDYFLAWLGYKGLVRYVTEGILAE